MKDLGGKFAGLVLLASAAFNIYIGANVPELASVMSSIGAGSAGTDKIVTTFPLMSIFVAAGLYGLIGLIVLFVKSIRSLNILMAVLAMGMAITLAVVAASTFNNSKVSSENIEQTSSGLGTYFGESTGNKFKTSMTAVAVLPSYAAMYGAAAGFVASILIYVRSSA